MNVSSSERSPHRPAPPAAALLGPPTRLVLLGVLLLSLLGAFPATGPIVHLLGRTGALAMLCLVGRRLLARIREAAAVRRKLVQSNARLAASEQRMARANRLLEMGEQIAQIGHWHLDLAADRRLTWSGEVYRLYGHKAGRFQPTMAAALDACHPEDRSAAEAAVARCIETGCSYELVSRVLHRDGTVRHVLSRGVPQADASGRTISVFGIVMDITRQRGIEAALLKAHAEAEATNAALALANATLEKLAMQDALTGLANRRHFDPRARPGVPPCRAGRARPGAGHDRCRPLQALQRPLRPPGR